MRKRLITIPMAALFVLASTASAFAYNTSGPSSTVDPTITDCVTCHDGDYSSGPHRGYMSTSRRCAACHEVHDANPGGVLLLAASTIRATCETCHDGTGGTGVYGVLAARGVPVVARHRIDATRLVPGGDPVTGGSVVATFSGVNNRLTCGDCHSAHGSDTVQAFLGDRPRSNNDTMFTSDRLLRRRPTSATRSVDVYGSDWCGGCHKGRLSGVTGHNHPTDSTYTTSTPLYYNRVSLVQTETSQLTTIGPMGRTNRGFLVPFPRSKDQTGHAPICQQCHADQRSVGTSGAVTHFTVTATWGVNAGDNPRFQVFPHESPSPQFQVETAENLCTNCHPSGSAMP